MGFVNSFIPSKSLGLVDYWERPFVPDQAFAVQWVSYYEPWGWFWPGPAWYGPLPLQPQPAPPLGGSPGQMVQDPTTILLYLMSGIKYYLTIQLFLSSVDPSQPFNKFLANYSDDLRDYADFSLSLYKNAVNGILKTAIPTATNIFHFLLSTNGYIIQVPDARLEQVSGGIPAPGPSTGAVARTSLRRFFCWEYYLDWRVRCC